MASLMLDEKSEWNKNNLNSLICSDNVATVFPSLSGYSTRKQMKGGDHNLRFCVEDIKA